MTTGSASGLWPAPSPKRSPSRVRIDGYRSRPVGDGSDVQVGDRPGGLATIDGVMALQLELSDADLLPEIMGALSRNGCLTNRITPKVCRVGYPCASDAREAWLEVGLFIRAWQLHHPGVEAILSI